MGKFIQEFKEFALKGNVMDMAVGIIIGGAFGKIITSLVNDIIMPPIAFCIFLMIKAMNAFRKKEEPAPEAPAATPEDIELLREIRDELKRRG